MHKIKKIWKFDILPYDEKVRAHFRKCSTMDYNDSAKAARIII